MSKSPEELWAQAQAATATANVMPVVLPRLEKRRAQLIRDAIRKYRSQDPTTKLTERDAFVFVSALAATYDLEDDLQRVVTDGQKAGQKYIDGR